MIIIALFNHFTTCFKCYSSRRKLRRLPHELRKDLGIMQDSFETEAAKGNLFTLLKELSTLPKIEHK